jgi:hypothetical protein
LPILILRLNSFNPKMEEPASEDDYEIEELEPEERTEKE